MPFGGDRLGFDGAEDIATHAMKRGNGRHPGAHVPLEVCDTQTGEVFRLTDGDQDAIAEAVLGASGDQGPHIAGKSVERILQQRRMDPTARVED